MRRLALLLASPLLMSAASPLAEAEREARAAAAEHRRLEQAAETARGAALKAAADARASAQAIIAADAAIAASEVQLAALAKRKSMLERRLAEARAPAAALVAGLVELGRRPQWLALAGAGSASEQVRLAALVRQVRPEVDRRSLALREEFEAFRQLGERQQKIRDELGRQRLAASAARSRFAALERESLAQAASRGQQAVLAEDRVLDRSERLAALRGATEQRRSAARLAAALSELPAAAPRPTAAEQPAASPSFEWRVPASGPITIGLGELGPNGVRARGVTIAAGMGTQVVAPAPGRIVFAGPFRRRAGVVIIDHGRGWMSLLSEVRPTLRVGERVESGQQLGRALGPVTAELFQGGTAEPAALIARSS